MSISGIDPNPKPKLSYSAIAGIQVQKQQQKQIINPKPKTIRRRFQYEWKPHPLFPNKQKDYINYFDFKVKDVKDKDFIPVCRFRYKVMNISKTIDKAQYNSMRGMEDIFMKLKMNDIMDQSDWNQYNIFEFKGFKGGYDVLSYVAAFNY